MVVKLVDESNVVRPGAPRAGDDLESDTIACYQCDAICDRAVVTEAILAAVFSLDKPVAFLGEYFNGSGYC
jgi:hypothetical protein